MTRLLFVEDNEDLAYAVSASLSVLGDYEITHAIDGEEGLELYNKIKPHIVVSDVEMPQMNGFEMTKAIRNINKECVIILATALSSTEDILKGFDIGIDEYIKKPYSPQELHARIQAILRRIQQSSTLKEDETISIGKYKLDDTKKCLYFSRETISLTPKEFSILDALVQSKNEIVSREFLTTELWGESDFFSSRSLDVFISKLRKYLSKDKNVKIVTVRGQGLKLMVEC